MGDAPELTPAEFDRWLSPRSVYEILKPHFRVDVWRPLLLKRINDAEVFAAARKVVYRQGNRTPEPRALERLPAGYWEHGAPTYVHDDFWESGDLVLVVHGHGYPQVDTQISCVDVRFESEGIRAMIPHVVTELPPPPTPARPQPGYRAKPKPPKGVKPGRVTLDELRPWFESYAANNRTFHADKVRTAAQIHFAPRPVGRDPIREVIHELGKTENRGKPAR